MKLSVLTTIVFAIMYLIEASNARFYKNLLLEELEENSPEILDYYKNY